MKIKKVLQWIIFSFLIGFVVSFLIHLGYWDKIRGGFSSISPFLYIPYFILFFYITLAVHELTHLVAFKLKGIPIRALYLTMFIFYKENHKLKFAVRPKLWVLLGGMVVPDLPEIKDDEAYKKVMKAFEISLISAPVATITFASLYMISTILILFLSTSLPMIGFMLLTNFFVLIFSIVYIWSSRLHTDQFYGDFVAHKKIKEDVIFQLIQINQYAQFSTLMTKTSEDYLFGLTKKTLVTHQLTYRLFDLMLVHQYVTHIITHKDDHIPAIMQKIESLNAHGLARSVHGIEVGYEVAACHYVLNQPAKAYQMIDILSKKKLKDMDEKHRLYLEKKFKHITYLENNQTFLDDDANIFIGQHWIFDPLIDPIQEHKETHQRLPFVVYETPVTLEDKEKSDETSP